MSELNKILKEEYAKKERTVTSASLFEMIEEIMGLPLSDISAIDASEETIDEDERYSMTIHI